MSRLRPGRSRIWWKTISVNNKSRCHITPQEGVPIGGQWDFAPVFASRLAAHPDGADFYIAPGTYHFWPDRAAEKRLIISNTDALTYPFKRIGILIENKKDITLMGEGAVFVFHGNLMALCLQNCQNIRIQGIRIRYACPSVIDAAVEKAEGHTALVSVPAPYTFGADGGKVLWQSEVSPYTGQCYWQGENGLVLSQRREKDGHTQRVSRDLFHLCQQAQRTPEGKLLLCYASPRENVRTGDIFQMRDTRRETAGMFIDQCAGVSFIDVAISFTPSMGIVSQNSRDLRFTGLTYKAAPPFYSASAADMLHFSGCRGGIEITRCVFDNPHDDPINVHGTYLTVQSIIGNQLTLRYCHPQSMGFPVFFPGDLMLFCDADSLEPLETIRVQNVVQPNEKAPGHAAVTLEREPALKGPVRIAAENLSTCPNVLIRDCTFSHVPTRGILAGGAGRIRIVDNCFEQVHMACIYHAADACEWYESGPVQDVLIAGNTAVHCHDAFVKLHPETGVHRNIRLSGNQTDTVIPS